MELILKEISGPLPTSFYELKENEKVIGRLQLRHIPSKSAGYPKEFESHIYYEIEPEFQGKGYGREILRLGLKEAKDRGLHEVVLTCTEENIQSQKVIEANGGRLIQIEPDREGLLIRKYIN